MTIPTDLPQLTPDQLRHLAAMLMSQVAEKDKALRHRDRGSQYASRDYRSTLDRHGFPASMGRKGSCWDNAVMERFFGSLKSEWLAGQRYWSRQAARRDVIEYIKMEYNSRRLHSTLSYQTPREIELAAAA